jgi:hypothetical protein
MVEVIITSPLTLLIAGLKHFSGRNKPQTHTLLGKYTSYLKTTQTQIYQENKQNYVKVFLYINRDQIIPKHL